MGDGDDRGEERKLGEAERIELRVSRGASTVGDARGAGEPGDSGGEGVPDVWC